MDAHTILVTGDFIEALKQVPQSERKSIKMVIDLLGCADSVDCVLVIAPGGTPLYVQGIGDYRLVFHIAPGSVTVLGLYKR